MELIQNVLYYFYVTDYFKMKKHGRKNTDFEEFQTNKLYIFYDRRFFYLFQINQESHKINYLKLIENASLFSKLKQYMYF